MADYEEELLKRLRRGTSTEPVAVTPGPEADPEAALIARLRSQATADKLTAPTQENPRGQVLPTPGWNIGKAIGNGMLQGYLPNIMAGFASPPRGDNGEALDISDPKVQEAYRQEVARHEADRQAYGKQNSGKALVGEIGGSMATAVPAMAAGAGLLAPIGKGIANAAPWASGLVDFLSGAGTGLARVPSLAARGAAEGVGSAALSSGLSDKPLGEQLTTGAALGAGLNPVLGSIASKFGGHVNATTADTAQALLDQGIAVRAGQVPGAGKITQGLDKMMGGGNAGQREAFAEKLSGFAGNPSKEISQEWVKQNDQRIGQTMNQIQSVYSIPALEHGLLTDLSAIRSHSLSNYSVENAKKIDGLISKVEDNTLNPMSGAVYKNLTQKGGLLDNIAKDKDIAGVAPQLREALDEAWGRSLPPDKKAAWDQARKEYKITRVIDDSMGASGAAEGVYNPKKLLSAVENRYGNVENAGDLGKLARGGQFLEAPGAPPASGHGMSKLLEKGLLVAGGAGAAAAGGHVANHISPAMILQAAQHPENYALPLAGLMGTYAGAKGLNAALNSPRATQYMLDVARGSRQPLLMGNNPVLPFAIQPYNQQ